jgi:hypothetical protein
MKNVCSRLHYLARWVLACICLVLSVYFFLLPGWMLISYLTDPAIRTGDIPPVAWQLSKHLASRYAQWARTRIELENHPSTVSGTEWPLFGSVFYLEAVDALQQDWFKNKRFSTVAPVVYGRDAIEAAVDLVVQPGQAKWVQQYWGKNYLHHEDVFYRYLLISSMTSYTNLTGNDRCLVQLRDQVDSLSAELDSSPQGLLDDYPGQCYPTDIISAIGAIKRADRVLHTDHSAFIQKALRAFVKPIADSHGLPPYNVMAPTGSQLQPSRGCGNSFALIATPNLWPEQSTDWYRRYVDQFWQERNGLVGFREFAKDTPASMEFMDVDSGPVIWNYGVAASAFGVGTARAQGDMERAAPLTAEMLVSSWPLPNGTLLMPRILSDSIDAPYVGEAGILYCLTRPIPPGTVPADGIMTPFVWLVLLGYFGLSIFLLLPMVMLARESYKYKNAKERFLHKV